MTINDIPFGYNGEDLRRAINDRLRRLASGVTGAAAAASSSGSAPTGSSRRHYDAEYALTGASTEITSPAAAVSSGDTFLLTLAPDANGREITFAAGPPEFKGVTINHIDGRNGRVTQILFMGRPDGNWYMVAATSYTP